MEEPSRFRAHPRLCLAVMAAFTAVSAVPALATAEDYETPPTLHARDLFPEAALEGPHHRVEDQVGSDGVALSFLIRSDFGSFEAPSREMAELRIAEVGAIAGLAELGSSEMFADALAASAKKKAESVKRAVEDPEGTVKGVGKGLKRVFGKAKKGAADAAEALEQDERSSEGETQKSGAAAEAGKDLIGLNKAKRQIAKAVGADPYSSNPALQAELERLAKAAVAGGLTANLGLRVPGADQVASVSSLAWDLPPEDLRDRNEKSLAAMGSDPATIKKLFANPAYSPSLATELVVALEKLPKLENRAALVTLASEAESEVEARFYRSSIALLAAARGAGSPPSRAQRYGRAPAALAADGTLVVAAAADLLVWTEGLKEAAARPAPDAKSRALWLTGRVSDHARRGLEAAGWELHETISVAPTPGDQ